MSSGHTSSPSGKNPQGDLTLMTVMQQFSTEEAARDYFEVSRWPNGPVCPHCGNAEAGRVYKVTANPGKKIRMGLYKCAACEQTFTVTVGTVMEDTHLPLNKWLIAFYMMCASKTQVSALQLQHQLEIGSYRSARFLYHRIRYALKNAAEGFFGNSKRSIDGTHHHISKQHAHFYFSELDYKYNNRKQLMAHAP